MKNNDFLNIILFYDNNLIMIRPRGGLWTWSILLDAYDEAFGLMVMVT